MQVVQIDSIERDFELWKGVQRGFLGPPVEILAPVFGEPAKVGDIGAVCPCVAGRPVGEAGAGQTIAQIGDVGVRNPKREGRRLDGHVRPVSCRLCALRTYIALSASSSARPASARGARMATPADAPAETLR